MGRQEDCLQGPENEHILDCSWIPWTRGEGFIISPDYEDEVTETSWRDQKEEEDIMLPDQKGISRQKMDFFRLDRMGKQTKKLVYRSRQRRTGHDQDAVR